ncbi:MULTISPECIES: hypothetical protein [Pectobacterium]|uniref:Uncharacterized protein n=1 Tax=Pectobacterium peruviense TaxID=2066479 RepID=A0ABX4SAD9_9GAMM|nr:MULTISPECIES: hypothetical protein [Pectobacterium]AIA69924.1 hypothetical protein EV46_04825 [Pectobacterium atrosepticum]AIK12841.1 hypothetical protein GZ59_09780 [Pectobacterium atrosepticum]ATY89417.1 hypothetical protein CVS35_03060 [Pectobacterium atrosepticum]KFX24007.1 hypothetical protein KP24_12855 [Pectobacterium atrosepticum]KML70046.1 hypothetical protein G033_02975 [Pectobacterium peruviense]
MSHIDITQEDLVPSASFTPEQEDALCQLIRRECFRRDRNALLKLLGYLTLLKVAGSLVLLALVLLLRGLIH